MTVVIQPPIPVGVMHQYAGATAPTGYLLCDGTAVSRATYAPLFAVVSTTYGIGDGSTTFNVPDLRGRVPMGAGTGTGLNASGTGAPTGTAQTARTRGAWGGEETHLLSSAEIPAHSHPVSDPGHTHGYGVIGNGQVGGGVVTPTNSMTFTQTTQSTTTGLTVSNNTGGGGRHAVVPPFTVLNYIIKT